MKRYSLLFVILGILFMTSCSEEFLEQFPNGVVTEDLLATNEGVANLLIGAYAMFDGHSVDGAYWGSRGAGPTQWVSELQSGDCYKGEAPWGWQELNPFEKLEILTTNVLVDQVWNAHYDGIARANDVVRVAKLALEEGNITEDYANEAMAEARFLRAYHHFLAQLKWYQVPFISDEDDPNEVANDHVIWQELEDDLTFCIAHLPDEQAQVGRVTGWAAKTMLARIHLFQQDFAAAKPLLDDIINNGGFSLMPEYWDNFDEEKQNNAESILEHQYAVNDGSAGSSNGSWDHCVSYSQTKDMGLCCDYQHPSLDLYNAYKVDPVTGLPLLDTYQDNYEVHDNLVASADSFVFADQWWDPRVDWVLGRRGIPMLDWGINRGADWANEPQIDQGPFVMKKVMFYKRNKSVLSTSTGWAKGVNANNWRIYRYAHVLLWRAEVAVEEGDLATALSLVNQVRERAQDDYVMGKCLTGVLPEGVEPVVDWDQPADQYLLGLYANFPDQDYARKAVRFEWRLEAALEGFRHFDLKRWGIIDEVMDKYIELDTQHRNWLIGTSFDFPRDAYWPIPQSQIDLSKGVLIQDPAY